MAGFFDNLTNGNIKMPDSQWNSGPLPSLENGPEGVNGIADGKYNFNDSLLSGITPYAYGEAARMGSDRNYQQIPHRSQQIIPLLYLPHANEKVQDLVCVSHVVDMGDVAFVVGSSRVQGILFDRSKQMDKMISSSELPNRNAFVNLATANYLLAGLQRLTKREYSNVYRSENSWQRLADDLNFNPEARDMRKEMLKLFRSGFVPFGVCAGSEKQGGMHETGLAPVQSAANHVTTMTVDGQNRDLINFWRHISLDMGDEIIYRLDYLPTQHYTLNHYYKGVINQSFSSQKMCWQIRPDVFRMAITPDQKNYPWPYDYRLHGYWRVGRMFHHRLKNDLPVQNWANDQAFLQGALLHVNFAPVFQQLEFPWEPPFSKNSSIVHNSVLNEQTGTETGQKRKFDFSINAFDRVNMSKFAKQQESAALDVTVKWKYPLVEKPLPPPPPRNASTTLKVGANSSDTTTLNLPATNPQKTKKRNVKVTKVPAPAADKEVSS